MLDKDGLNEEISVGVNFSAAMAAVSLFFVGILISQYRSFAPSIKVPLLYLIISTFSFIFVASIYNNAGAEITVGKVKTVEKYLVYAKNVAELLGLYPLILSIPLVVGAVTRDNFLRVSTIVVATLALTLYTESRFSVLEKQLRARAKRLYAALILVLSLVLYTLQTAAWPPLSFGYSTVAVLVLLALLIPAAYFSLHSRQYGVLRIRPFRDSDAAALSTIIQKNIRLAQRGRQPTEVIEAMTANGSEQTIVDLARTADVFVAVLGSRPVGVAGLRKDTLLAIFTDPDVHRKGIGRMLMDAVEVAASDRHYEHIQVLALASNRKFYAKLGYERVRQAEDGQILMQKEI